uniref:CopM family metallochaperone n=1 Tax=Citrobacter freundii TaxID=546 RepID=UPI0023B123C7
ILMLSLPAISAEHSEMKMSDMHSSASSQEYMAGMKNMHEKMMAAVNESNPDKAFAKGMIAHHEGAIAMAETELKYGKDPEMRKLAQDIIKAQKGEIEGNDSNLLIVFYVQIMPDDLVMQLHRF